MEEILEKVQRNGRREKKTKQINVIEKIFSFRSHANNWISLSEKEMKK